MNTNLIPWLSFLFFVFLMLSIDLGIFQRRSHSVTMREATVWTIVWISLAMLFNLGIYFFWHNIVPSSELSNSNAAYAFLAAYVIEKALSVDNLFIFVLIFTYFAVATQHQHRVLFYGILGALLFRGVLIITGVALISRFHWLLYIFGAFLLYTGYRLLRSEDEEIVPEKNPLFRWVKRLLPITEDYDESHFFVRKNGLLFATPLLIVLVVVESTDILFALDSIPAVFAITTDPFIAFTSNIFAILGLRSLYFLLAGLMHKFHYLQWGLAFILMFIGSKMLMEEIYKLPTIVSLCVIVVTLAASVIASIMWSPSQQEAPGSQTTA